MYAERIRPGPLTLSYSILCGRSLRDVITRGTSLRDVI
jgi:hypothetical protein